MRNTRKILVALLVLMTILTSLAVVAIPASAEAATTLYLTPNANWKADGARFAAYFFGNGEKWVSMTDSDKDGIYEVAVPAGYPSVIFCRMNPNASANNWNNKWNQTSDLTVPTSGTNHYTVKEGTWDKGGGTWSTFGSTCAHENLGPAATCTTAQVCQDCGDPVVSELGHSYNTAHLCTRCNEQATFTVAGSGAHLGTEWDTGNKANDMTYADGVYTKVYTNVAAGSYLLKVARDHDWGTAYPSADKAYTVATAGSTVTVTLKGTTVDITVEAPHTCSFSDATCTEPAKCECGKTQGEALGHNYEGCECTRCDSTNHVLEQNVFYHPELVAATCCTTGVEIWECTVEGCDYYEKREAPIDPEAHAFWGDREVITEANCATKTNGLVKVACDNGCGQFKEVEVEYTEAHNWDVQKEISATCTVDGEYYAVCTICNEVESYSSKAQGHHNWYLTCGQSGTCMECGAEFTAAPHTVDPCEGGFCDNCMEMIEGHHDFVEGKCSVCGAEDPDYVPEVPVTNDKLINFSTWEEFAKETYADGDIVKFNDIFTFIMGKNSRVDASPKTWDDFSGTLRFSLGGKTNSGVPTKNAIQITVDGAHTLKIWYVAGGDGRYFELRDAAGNALSTTTSETVKNSQYYGELELPAAGVYYLTIPADNNYIFQLELVAKAGEEPETPHVNTLVVGDTNKIVVSGNTLNAAGAPIEWVEFVVTEKAHYEFTGDTYAFIYNKMDLADFTACVCGFSGKADLEPGTYYICLGGVATGEFNITVTMSAILEQVTVGDNKVVVSGNTLNAAGAPIEWVEFVVTEKAHYEFTGDTYAFIYNKMDLADFTACVCGFSGKADLEPGTYYICVGGVVAGEFNITVTMSAIEGGDEPVDPPVTPELPALQLGDNAVVIDGSQTNLVGKAVAWYTFTPANAGVYKFACSDLTVYILTSQNMGDLNAYVGADGVAELEAGVQYFVLVGKDGVTGEFTLNISDGAAPVHKNTIVVGDNHYIISDTLLGIGYEFLAVEITEPGTYVITGGAPMQVYFFTVPGTLNESSPHKVNIDGVSLEFVDSFEVTLTEAGTYWIGFRYDHVGDEREFDINISLKPASEQPDETPDEQPEQPEEKPEQPAPELSLFEKIMQTINEFIAKITAWFKSFIAGLKK